MAALCCPSPWSVMAELKLGQNIHRNSVPVRWEKVFFCLFSYNQASTEFKISDMPDELCPKVRLKKWWSIKHYSLVTHQSWRTYQSGRQIHWVVYFGLGLVGRGPRRWPDHSTLRRREWPWSRQHLCTVETLRFHWQQQHEIEILTPWTLNN